MNRRGLSREGMPYWAGQRGQLAGVPFFGGQAMTAVKLDAPVHYAPLGAWEGEQ